MDTRVTINMFIDEPVYRVSRKFAFNVNEFHRQVVLNEMLACANRLQEEPTGSMNDVVVKTLIRLFKLMATDEARDLTILNAHSLAWYIAKKAWGVLHRSNKPGNWWTARKHPERLVLKALADRALSLCVCDIEDVDMSEL